MHNRRAKGICLRSNVVVVLCRLAQLTWRNGRLPSKTPHATRNTRTARKTLRPCGSGGVQGSDKPARCAFSLATEQLQYNKEKKNFFLFARPCSLSRGWQKPKAAIVLVLWPLVVYTPPTLEKYRDKSRKKIEASDWARAKQETRKIYEETGGRGNTCNMMSLASSRLSVSSCGSLLSSSLPNVLNAVMGFFTWFSYRARGDERQRLETFGTRTRTLTLSTKAMPLAHHACAANRPGDVHMATLNNAPPACLSPLAYVRTPGGLKGCRDLSGVKAGQGPPRATTAKARRAKEAPHPPKFGTKCM